MAQNMLSLFDVIKHVAATIACGFFTGKAERTGWRLMIFCARATRGRPSTQLGTLSLSKGGLPSLDARNRRSISPHPWRETEQAWREHL